jgi:hypothetical protein
VIKLVTDARTVDDCRARIERVLQTDEWAPFQARIVATAGTRGAGGNDNERFWRFEVSDRRGRWSFFVSRDNRDELPFIEYYDHNENVFRRRHIDPVTGNWVKQYEHRGDQVGRGRAAP